MYSLLMERVKPEERGGASALNFLVIFGGQAVAAALAGFAVRSFGYSVVLISAAITALLAAITVRQIPSIIAPYRDNEANPTHQRKLPSP